MSRRAGDIIFATITIFALIIFFGVAGVGGMQYPEKSATIPILVAIWASGLFWLFAGVLPIGLKIFRKQSQANSDVLRIDNFEIIGAAANGFAAAAASFAGLAAMHLTSA